MHVAHINVRLSEGGAARVALTLHREMLERGVRSTFLYGYGPRGGDSPAHQTVTNAFRITGRTTALANRVWHRAMGIDPFLRASELNRYERFVDLADIVHVHAIHSHMGSMSKLLGPLREKKVVWTHHDAWAVTGRCAFPGECTGWEEACAPCRDRLAYPPSWTDRASGQFRRKRHLLSSLRNVTHVTPSSHLRHDIGRGLGVSVTVISNGISEHPLRIEDRKSDNPRLAVVGVNLSDTGKYDLSLINDVLCDGRVTLVFVGSHTPFEHPNAEVHGYIADPSKYYNVLNSCDALLFTSKVDNQPLVVLESLCQGIPILFTDSPAAVEICKPFQARPVGSAPDVVEALLNGFAGTGWQRWSRAAIATKARELYSARRMADEYAALYEAIHH